MKKAAGGGGVVGGGGGWGWGAGERKHPALAADAKVNLSLQNAPLRSSALNTDANMMFAAAKYPLLQASTDSKPARPRIRDGARS